MKYFTIEELCETNTGLANEPTQLIIDNLTYLVDNVLDPAREALGSPIGVNSGYRSKAVNDHVKGKSNSQHLVGQAADLDAGTKDDNKKLFNIIKAFGKYDQLINEYDFSWVHVSYTKGFNRKQLVVVK